jgi:hypothetical protein
MTGGPIPFENLGDHFDRMAAAADAPNLAAAMEEAQKLVLVDIGRNFIAAATPEGVSWPPRKDNLPHPLLIKSGALESAATGTGAGAILRVQAREAEVGIDLDVIPYARAQDRGYAPRNLPARHFHGATSKTLEGIGALLLEAIEPILLDVP